MKIPQHVEGRGARRTRVVTDDLRVAKIAVQLALLEFVGLMHRECADAFCRGGDQHPPERRVHYRVTDFSSVAPKFPAPPARFEQFGHDDYPWVTCAVRFAECHKV